MDGQLLRLDGVRVSQFDGRSELKVWTYNSDRLYGLDRNKETVYMDLSTGLVANCETVETILWAKGFPEDLATKREVVAAKDFKDWMEQVIHIEHEQKTEELTKYHKFQWEKCPKATTSQMRLLKMLTDPRIDADGFVKGYEGLGGWLQIKARRRKEGGWLFTSRDSKSWTNDFTIDYLLDSVSKRKE